MNCKSCGTVISDSDKYCKFCGELNEFSEVLPEMEPVQTQINYSNKKKQEDDNKTSLILGILSVVFSTLSYIILGIMSFAIVVISIFGLNIAIKNSKEGFNGIAALVLNIIGLVLSSISALLMLIYFIF